MYQPGDGSDHAANRDALDKVSGDRAFTCPTIELTDTLTDAGKNSYFYYLTHRASNEVWPPWMGVVHGAEIQVRTIILCEPRPTFVNVSEVKGKVLPYLLLCIGPGADPGVQAVS